MYNQFFLNSAVMKMRELELNNETTISEDEDADLCGTKEISNLFTSCKHTTGKQIYPNKYILQLTGTMESYPKLAVGLSDSTCEVWNLNDTELQKTCTIVEHTDSIAGSKFGIDNNILYTASGDGTIRLWDLRTPNKSQIIFKDTTMDNGTHKTFSCFDLSPNERLLVAGTNIYDGDAFILFWDVRKTNLLGGYWESHTDDITDVQFHLDDSDKLISGSVDGLINVYDLSQSSEEDALIESLNTESSIEKLNWHADPTNDIISCITHTADVQFWKTDHAQPFKHLYRDDHAKYIKRKNKDFIYVVNIHSTNDEMLVLCGSNYHDGETFRSYRIVGKNISPAIQFVENKQRVRTSWYNFNLNLLITGGEKGIIDCWKPDAQTRKR